MAAAFLNKYILSGLDTVLCEQAFGAVVPHILRNDQPVADDEPVDIAVALEGRSIRPFAIKRAKAVDDRFRLSDRKSVV